MKNKRVWRIWILVSAVVSFVVFGLLLASGVVLLGLSAFMLLCNAYAAMSPDYDGTLPATWGQVVWPAGASFVSFLCSWPFLAVGVGMLLRLRAKK
jgi:hypothetical protein